MLSIEDYGYDYKDIEVSEGMIPGRITQVQRERYTAVCGHGEVSAVASGAFAHAALGRDDFPAVGDYVLMRYNPAGDCAIARLLPRKSKISRADTSGHKEGFVKTIMEQVLAANFDTAFIMTSLNLDFSPQRVSRYLTLARQSGGEPVVLLTKLDLVEDVSKHMEALSRIASDIPVVALSSLTGEGLSALTPYLQPRRTVVFLGMSGVGKSSLLNALAGEELMAVKEIREDDSRGRHTTTHRELFRLPGGAMVIDTPGMRELGMWDAQEGVKLSFGDVEALFAKCRFGNCTHKSEPGCAVNEALDSGELPQEMWTAYCRQSREAAVIARMAATKDDRRARKLAMASGKGKPPRPYADD